ncbi:MAG: hypothetical protein ACYSW8_29485 [Planctomycetota bacterium]|jgi:hypothetical protein
MYEKVAKHNKAALAAAKRYAGSKPWRGTFEERVAKIRALHVELLDAYDLSVDLIIDTEGGDPANAGGFVTYDTPEGGGGIVLRPGFAVMTYFRLFAEALEYDRDMKFSGDEGVPSYAARWANGLFSKAFPLSWQKLVDRDAPILTRNYA